MKIIIIGTIISFLVIVGVVIFNIVTGDSPSEQEESQELEQDKETSFLDRLFGGGGDKEEESTSSGSGTTFLDRLFGGSGGESNNDDEKIGTETEVSDSSAPRRSNASPSGEVPYYTKKANISLKTNEVAVCRYDSVKGMRYEAMKAFSSTGSTSHSTEVTGLSEGQEYKYYVKCQDLDMNINETDFIISFEVAEPKDETPPQRTNAYPFDQVFPAGTKKVVIGVSTDEKATCRYDDESNTSYNSMPRSLSPYDDTKKYHTATITVENNKSYEFFVICKDEAGNVNTGDVLISFSISY